MAAAIVIIADATDSNASTKTPTLSAPPAASIVITMHGKKRDEYKARMRDPKTAAALEQKAQQWYQLMEELQRRRVAATHSGDSATTTATTLALLEKALLVNPDPTNLWNHRRELLLQQQKNWLTFDDVPLNNEGKEDTATSKLLATELGLTQAALQRNPKSYGAWFHRKWIMQYIKPETRVLQEELQLTSQFLMLDERNFHCWNHRRFVVACMAGSWDGEWIVAARDDQETPPSLMGPQVSMPTLLESKPHIPIGLINSEFDFTTTKIKDNFSNFSAFHYRSQLLELIEKGTGDERAENMHAVLEKEFQLIEDAFCTEPDDQTSWWYHAILLDKIEAERDSFTSLQPRLAEQRELLRELIDDSPGKWVTLGLHRLLQVLELLEPGETTSSGTKHEQEQLLHRLIALDPDRSNRYGDLLQKLA